MKWLYKLVLGFLGVLLSGTLIVWILSKTIQPETVRDYLNTQLGSFTSQKIAIKGAVSWQLFPRPAIKISNISAGNDVLNSPYFLHIDDLLFNVKITPLLHGKLVFSELKIDGLNAKLDANLVSKVKQSATTEIHPAPIGPTQGQFAIEQLMLSHSTITLVKDKQELVLKHLQVGANQFNLLQKGFPFQLKTELTLKTPEAQLAHAQINFSGNSLINKHNKKNSISAAWNETGFEGQLSITDAKIGSIAVDSLNANTRYKNNTIHLNPMAMTLYHGEAIGDIDYNANNQTLTINQTATNLNASALFEAVLNKKLGKGSLDVSLHSLTMLQHESWPNNTQAKGYLTLRDGALISFNLNQLIDTISDKINQLFQSKPNQSPQNKTTNPFQIKQFDDPSLLQGDTPLKQLSMTYSLNNGNLTCDPILLQTERLELKGHSVVNLTTKQLHGQLNAQVVFNNDKADNIQKILNGSFPLNLGGSLTEPTLSPDLAQINTQLTKEWLKKTLKTPVNLLKNQVNQLLKP